MMRAICLSALQGIVAIATAVAAVAGEMSPQHVLWYKQPAIHWTEALPMGNGRLGAMVFGRVGQEQIALNEDTLYGGEPTLVGVPSIHQHVDAVFDLVKAGRFTEADRLVLDKMTGRLHQSFTTLGNLCYKMAHGEVVSDYHRELDLGRAISKVTSELLQSQVKRS